MKTLVFEISDADSGQRLDRLLAGRLGVARNQIQRWIRQGHVRVDGSDIKASHVASVGERVECTPQELDAGSGIEPERGDLDVLFEDSAVVVLDKPAGLVVHPGAGNLTGTLVHRLLARYPEIANVGGPGRPGIVHRLDKDTSGIMVVARSPRAYEGLSRDFAERRVGKTYVAVVFGSPDLDTATIDTPIRRHPSRRKEMTALAGGRPALTRYRRIVSAAGISLLEVDLATGRTHQIRVHLKSVGHPLVGDPVYGEARWKSFPRHRQAVLRAFRRPALHAWKLRFQHPLSGDPLELSAPVPPDLRALWQGVTAAPFPVELDQPSSSLSGL